LYEGRLLVRPLSALHHSLSIQHLGAVPVEQPVRFRITSGNAQHKRAFCLSRFPGRRFTQAKSLVLSLLPGTKLAAFIKKDDLDPTIDRFFLSTLQRKPNPWRIDRLNNSPGFSISEASIRE
jgi:hypothetical protein